MNFGVPLFVQGRSIFQKAPLCRGSWTRSGLREFVTPAPIEAILLWKMVVELLPSRLRRDTSLGEGGF